MFKCLDVQMFRCSDVQMLKCSNFSHFCLGFDYIFERWDFVGITIQDHKIVGID